MGGNAGWYPTATGAVAFQPSANYYAELNITLPYGNITESLAAYVAENGNLRMDFNGGVNSFRYTDGTSSEIEPTTLNLDGQNETLHVQQTCFVYPNHPLPAAKKPIFPDVSFYVLKEQTESMGMKFKTALLDLHMFHPEAHLEEKKGLFDQHCAEHGKVYEDPAEYAKRAVHFHHSLRLINASNRTKALLLP
eukprot:jgi/Pico_ML_1/52368/g3080.t1